MQARNTQFVSQVSAAVDAIIAAVGKQLIVRARLHDVPIAKYTDFVCILYGREPVGNENNSRVLQAN